MIVHAHASIEAAKMVVAAICDAGGSAEAWTCDLTDIAGTEAALHRVLADGVPQILVHGAGSTTTRRWRACRNSSGAGSSMCRYTAFML